MTFFGGLLGFMCLILPFSELSLTAGLHSSLRADLWPPPSTPISQTDNLWLISSLYSSIIHATYLVLMEEGQKKVERGHYLFAGCCLLVTVRKFLYLAADSSNPEHALTSDPDDQIGLCNGMEWLRYCSPMGICRDGKERHVLKAVWRGN